MQISVKGGQFQEENLIHILQYSQFGGGDLITNNWFHKSPKKNIVAEYFTFFGCKWKLKSENAW